MHRGTEQQPHSSADCQPDSKSYTCANDVSNFCAHGHTKSFANRTNFCAITFNSSHSCTDRRSHRRSIGCTNDSVQYLHELLSRWLPVQRLL